MRSSRTRWRISATLTLQGRYADATPVIDEALGIRRELYGDGTTPSRREPQDRAFNRYHLGDYEHASRRCAPRSRCAARYIRGSPRLGRGLNNLASLFIKRAITSPRAARTRKRSTWSASSSGRSTKTSRRHSINFGQVLHDQTEYERAEANYREALAMQKHLLGESHPDLVLTMNNLAFLFYDEGTNREAIAMLGERTRSRVRRSARPSGRRRRSRRTSATGSRRKASTRRR